MKTTKENVEPEFREEASVAIVERIFKKGFVPKDRNHLSANTQARRGEGLVLTNGVCLRRDVQKGKWYLTSKEDKIPEFIKELNERD